MSSSDDNNNIADSGDITPTDHIGDRVDTPNPNDVLCGRGGNINSHTGNEQFRKLVEKRKRVYLTARFKREKRLIASSIVNEIRAMKPPGRFLARKGSMKDDSGFWYDIGDEKARDKTSQALRENAPSIRAEIETEINQQRAEMRRQETAADPPPASAKTSPNESLSYPSPPMGHHHPGSHVHHGHPPPPPPHPVHSYSPHQSHYTQQYYDYYYHYYGYGAPPPPPPPGYTGSGAPPEGTPHPPHPPGFPHANPPHPYWATQSTTPGTNTNAAGSTPPPPPVPPGSSHPMGAMSTNAVVSPSPPPRASRANGMHSNPTPKTDGNPIPIVADHASAVTSMNSTAHPHHYTKARNQEEEDRRLAIALQNEENAKAFEDRNRRFGSDRRSSRSTAYCAPGYRPRLLNDSVEAPSESHGSTPNRKKRPPMSASHFFASTHSHNRERTNSGSNAMGGNPFHNETPTASTPTNVNMGSDPNVRMNHEDQYEMNLKPPAAMNPKERHEHSTTNVDNNHGIDRNHDHNHDHNHDFSISSFSTKGRMEFKDDSEFSLFGEGGTVIPPSNANSTGSFTRVRNIFAGTSPNTSKQNDNSNNQFNPIALDQSDRNHRQVQHQPQLSGSGNNANSNRQGHDDYDHNQQHQQQQNHQENNQESSLLSQVTTHILGNLGVGGSTWNDSNNSSNKQEHHHRGNSDEGEMEMELGQEVIMDVRDESSSIPPPNKRGNGTQIDWPSRTGCHTWIPDSMVDTTGSCNFGHDDNSRDEDVNHQPAAMPHHQHQNNQQHQRQHQHQHQHQHHRHRHPNDHSLMRESSYGRSDISPINSMDMDFSHSSNMGVRERSNNNNNNGGGSYTSSSLMNVFDQKTVDSNPEELLPQIHRSVLQKVPSWDRNYRSRSPVSLGEISGVHEMDNSLIRVHSRDGKDKMFGNMGNTTVSQPPSSTGQHNMHQQPHIHQNHHDENHHHPHQGLQYHQPVKSSSMHGHHHHIHQDLHNQAPLSSQTQNYSESREIDMDWD